MIYNRLEVESTLIHEKFLTVSGGGCLKGTELAGKAPIGIAWISPAVHR